MTEVNTSDTSGASSEYLDISNQAVVGERELHDHTVTSIDCGEWDEYQDPPSFLAEAQDPPSFLDTEPTAESSPIRPPRHRGPDNPLAGLPSDWPPRQLSSTDPNFIDLVDKEIPARNNEHLEQVSEASSEEDNVFDDEMVNNDNLANKFKDEETIWSAEIKKILQANKVNQIDYNDLLEQYRVAKDIVNKMRKNLGAEMENEFPNVVEGYEKMKADLNAVETIKEDQDAAAAARNPRNIVAPAQAVADNAQPVPQMDPDAEADREIAKTTVWYDMVQGELTSIGEELRAKLITADGSPVEPNDMLTMDVKEIETTLKDLKKESLKVQLEIKQIIIRYSTQEKKNAATNTLSMHVRNAKTEVDRNMALVIGYLTRVPAAAPAQAQVVQIQQPAAAPAATPNPYSRLQRIPLPKFYGRKTEYLCFKEEFERQATFPTEGDKVAALKEISLQKSGDRKRISKCLTLADCWVKLDKDYGDATTLATECSSIIASQKNPVSDKDFISFMDKVEECVDALKGVQIGKTYIPTLILTIEQKLSKEMKDKLSLDIVKQKPSPDQKPEFVLQYLADEKSAAKLRGANYTKPQSSSKKEESDDEVKVHETRTEDKDKPKGIRGNYRGRGKGGRGRGDSDRGQGQQQHRESGGARGRGHRGRGGFQRGGQRRGETSNKCLVCGDDHNTSKCSNWSNLETSKYELLGLAKHGLERPLCTWCLDPGHKYYQCTSQDDLGCPCGSNFSALLCVKTPQCVSRENWNNTKGNTATACSSSAKVNNVKIGQTLNPIIKVRVSQSNVVLNSLFDNCSQSTFLLNSVAKKLKLKGSMVNYVLICTDGSRTQKNGFIYNMQIKDVYGNSHHIEAIGIDKISSSYSAVKVVNVKRALSSNMKCKLLTDDKLSRDGGEIQLLVGTDVASLHPEKITNIKDLVIMSTIFGNGYTMMGHHEKHVKLKDAKMESKVLVTAVENIRKVEEVACNVVTTKDFQFLEAIATESIGVNVAPKCRTCNIRSDNCQECKMIMNNKTYLEHLQDVQIENSIEKIKDGPGYLASYPYNSEISRLLTNEDISKKRAEDVENKMIKNPSDLELINKEIQKSFDNGAFKFLSDEEVETWEGQVHYLPMNVSYKDSDSTPVRLCFDAAQPDRNGRSLNSCMGKGSNPVNNIGSVILNFRAAEQVACGDITKMFQCVKVRPLDMHLRRFYMRPDLLGGKKPWKIAVPTCINFGEKAAPSVATRVKDRTADDNRSISPEIADTVKKNCVMDDINIDAKFSENLDEKIQKTELMLGKGNFKFKKWIKSGDKGEKEIGKSEMSKSLGMYWDTEKDVLSYRIRLNFSKKKRNRYVAPDTTLKSLTKDFPSPMTKRIALKLNHSVFDPENVLQPIMLKQRLAYREILIHEKKTENPGWDKPLDDKFRNQWIKLTEEMFQLESLEFPRSLVPRDYDPNYKPSLCLFSDGSDLGQCVVSYLVWKLKDGSSHVSLITSRTKIASMTKISTPKSELCAAQLSSRLRCWLVQEMDIKVGDIYHFVDASIIIGMLKNISLKFDSYTAPRITEIQMNTPVEEWFWLDTFDNPADIGTRGQCSVSDLEPGKMWREGPAWLKNPVESWPLRSDFRKHEVPNVKKEFEILPPTITNLTQLVQIHNTIDPKEIEENEVVVNTVKAEEEDILNDLDVSRYSSWMKVVRVVKQMLKWKEKVPDEVDLMKKARMMLLRSMMKDTREMLKTTKLPGLLIHEKDGLVLARTRNRTENQNPEDLIVLSPKSPLTKLILKTFHDINHRGIQHCVARSRIFYWIPQAAKLMKSIQNSCYQCKLQNTEALTQLMSPLPEKRLKSSPVWHFSMLDLFGPIEVTNFVNQRTTRKTWAVIITCLTTRAVWVYLAESYSTDHLLSVLKKHEARNGSPAEYHADLGRQIIGADRVLTEAVKEIDTKEVEKFAAHRNVKFKFGTPKFPEGQGAVERLIAEVKKNLKVITRMRTLTFGELDTLLSEASYLVNCRPLQYNPRHGEDGFLCPNDILFGRSDQEPPMIDVKDSSLTRRAVQKQKIIEEFWDKWSQSYFQTLVKYQKWKNQSRNVTPGDIVLILDREIQKGKFTRGVVDSVKIDDDKVVRKATIKYRLQKKCDDMKKSLFPTVKYRPGEYKYIERSVRGLALLVTSEDRKKSEEIDIDVLRQTMKKKETVETIEENSETEESSNDDSNEVEVNSKNDNTDSEVEENNDAESNDDENDDSGNKKDVEKKDLDEKKKTESKEAKKKLLPPSSTGRMRFLPRKFM